MNRNDRRKLAGAVRKSCAVSKRSASELRNTIEELKAAEEEKLENLPESLSESRQAENIQEAIEELEGLLECIETAETAYEEIEDINGEKTEDVSEKAVPVPTIMERRDCRFQILLSSNLLMKLKQSSMETGRSCNEIVYRALEQYLAE